MSRLFWLHDESLALPADYQADDLLVYIWDEDYFAQQQWSFKRRLFIYETLCELPIAIFAGKTLDVITELSREHAIDEIRVQKALDPQLQQLIYLVASKLAMVCQTAYPQLFADQSLKPAKRFHAYWKQVAPLLGLNKPDKKWH